jgi:uncharacterized protein YegJ (DUF2314 family)
MIERAVGLASATTKQAFGVMALVIGVTLLGWFAYNQVWPTKEFTRNYRSILQLALPVAMLRYGWKWVRDDGPGIEALQVDFNGPEFRASVVRARKTLPSFLDTVQRHADGAYIKFPLVTDGETTEHIWGYVHQYAEGVFNVSLANTPFTQAGPVEGRRDVNDADVEDWLIMTPDSRIKGAFSIRALFEHADRKGVHLNRTMRQQRAQLVA